MATGTIEYRDFLVPSPFTSLAEAVVLSELSKSKAFEKQTSVYSYRWPSAERCPYNFDHYLQGYNKRNSDISSALRSFPGSVVIVTDIEKFYPTIPHDIVRKRFTQRIDESTLDISTRETSLVLFEHLLAPSSSNLGIATGPELSHVIGDVALSHVDSYFSHRLPGRYFRYVDDIIFVVSPQEADAIVQELRDQLELVKLKANSEKADVISSADWLEHSPDFTKRIRSLSFESLVFRLKVFLATKPHRTASLKTALQNEGFSIPLERLATRSKLSIFQARLKVLFKRGWMVLVRALQDDEKSLVDFAKQVRANFESQMRSIIECQISGSGSRRRWDIQRLRFIANRCLYLLPASDLTNIDEFLSSIPEFAETSALIKLLRHKDARDLLEMPGPAVAAAASIICASMDSGAKLILSEKLSEPAIHSAAVLLLYDVATITDDALKQVNPNSALFLRFCAGQAATHRELHDFSYLDEIRCLQLGRDKSQNRHMLESRFSDGESIALEALEIGGDYDIDA